MFGQNERIKRLEDRVESLERQLKSQADFNNAFFDVINKKYKNTEQIIEKYVQEHIWYTSVENLQAFTTGGRIRVALQDAYSEYRPETKHPAKTKHYEEPKKKAKKKVKGDE